jgi:hypothetical protein
MLSTSIENQILICVTRPFLDAKTAQRLRELLVKDVNWGCLLSSAERHCLIPLMNRHLAFLGHPEVPEQVMSRLRELDKGSTQSSLHLTGELIKLLDFLAAHDIQAIPFKGPALALLAYGDLSLRQFGDLDILVNRRDFSVVVDLLAGHGFAPRPALPRSREPALVRFDCSHNFASENNVYVDLHWDIAPRYFSLGLDPDRLWDRLQPITLNGRRLMTLSTEDLLLVLCLHGFTHFWERLGWISDVASLIERQKDIDWDLLVDNAIRLGYRRILALGLLLASELLDADVPLEVWKRVPVDATVKALAQQVQDQLFSQRSNGGIIEETRLHLSMRERKRDKLKSFFHLLATPRPNDWKLVSLPASLFFLYYPLRPLRLAGKFGASLLNGSSGKAKSA